VNPTGRLLGRTWFPAIVTPIYMIAFYIAIADMSNESKLYPIALMAFLLLVIVAQVVSEAKALRQEQDDDEPEPAGRVVRRWVGDVRLRRHLYTTVALVVLIAAAPVIGWTVSSTAFVVGLMVALGVRSVPALVMYGLGSAAFNYFALMQGMGLPLPRGFLF
jgi:Tripartite tricarboxylate transporter TctB family